MGTYTGHRESHPLGGASASAAYHTAYYSDPLLYSQLRPNPSDIRTDFAHLDRRSSHAPLAVGAPSMPYGTGSLLASAYPGGGPVARTSTGTPYGSAAVIGGVYPGGGTIAGFELRGSDSHGGVVSSDLHSQALLAEAQALGSELHPYGRYSHSLLAGLQPYGRNPSGLLAGRSDSQPYGESLHAFAAAGTALSDALLARGTESYGQRSNAFLAGANAKAFAAQMAPHGKFPLQVYGSLAEKAGVLTAERNVLSEVKVSRKAAEQNVLTASKRVGAAMERKRKLTLDALIKETWELHSLFRAGLAAAGEKRKISDDGVAEEARPKQKREQKTPAVNHTTTDGGGWGYPGSPGEAQPANTWDEPSKGEPEPDAPSSSNTMAKGASLIKEVRQEHYASNLHRIACENVAKFMGNSSDDDESDGEFYTDSDEEAPDPFVRSSDNLKSREEQAYDFFLQLFEGNQELQNLYKEQCNVGKFECLVCSSITGKPIKRFNGLVSVVMHASKIQKTKKKQEHRGYGRAVCSILGWDLRRMSALPNCPSLRPRGCLPPDEEEEPEASVQLNMEDGDDSEVEEEEKNAEALEESEDDEAKEEDTRLDVEERNHEASEDSDASEGSEESDAGEDTEAED